MSLDTVVGPILPAAGILAGGRSQEWLPHINAMQSFRFQNCTLQ
jgi:hypothetical protein